MKRIIIAAAAVAVLAGCGSSHPAYADGAVCRGLASATKATEESGHFTFIAQEQVLILNHPGALSPRFRRDVMAVVRTGLNNPSSAAVVRLTADCVGHGVIQPIWPADLIGQGG